MERFFISESNGVIEFTWPIVLSLLTVLTGGIAGTILWYRKHPDSDKLLKVIAGLQLAEFLAVNIWYRVAGYMAYPLPLFHCRLAKLFLIFFAFLPRTWRKTMRPLYVYSLVMAFFGAVSSFVYPDPDPFLWPHITHIGYFFGHFNLGILSMAFMMESEEQLTWRDLGRAQFLLLTFNFGILAVARRTGINYSYLLESPLFNAQLQVFGQVAYAVLMFLIYIILFTVAFVLMKLIEIRAKKGYQYHHEIT